ncbi:MAG TPA: DNA recombination protein RmuC [Thermoanaerobaculia bacterium]|nr:DNA recombination protein RmuC [Thermoanaerobaculia bacterium]
MLITIALCAVALCVGWVVGSARARERVAIADQARAVAEARVADVKRMENAFAATAQRVFTEVGSTIVQQNKVQVDGSLDTKKAEIATLLEPLNQMLFDYRGELQKSERLRNEVYGGLSEQIRTLLATQETARRETARLATALESPKVSGSWGENTLKRCIELAGMSEFCDFETQRTFFDDDGRRLRPDVVVKLPNKRVIAIDAKVPLAEYSAAANETNEERKRHYLAQHVKTMRRHIDSLSRREYQSVIGETLDFTVMFLPGEHFISAGLITDPTLFEFASEKKVVLASPIILLPLLKAIATGWKAERTEENAKKMHDAGIELFNRFVKVMELIAETGSSLQKTVEKYNATIRSIDTRLWPKGEEMQRMAGSGKDLGTLDQIEAVPLESSRLRLTMQQTEPGDVVKIGG